jgi:hypothetical protein
MSQLRVEHGNSWYCTNASIIFASLHRLPSVDLLEMENRRLIGLETVMLGRTNSMPQAAQQGSREVGSLVACLLLSHYAELLDEISL